MTAHASRVATAPGRVTLIGEHTDYNDGCSLGVATRERITVEAQLHDSGVVEVSSTALGSAATRLDAPKGEPFVLLATALVASVGAPGARLEVTTELAIGKGLSSSAAYAVAIALALGLSGDEVSLAQTCQAAERSAGADVGLLDQLVILAARQGCVVDLDFASLSVSTFELATAVGLSIVDTGERRLVASSRYAERRAECEAAAGVIGTLGTASTGDLVALGDPVLRRRARHVITECARVDVARDALRSGDLAAFGTVLDEGHRSLRDDFDSSTAHVDAVRAAVLALDGVAGARMTGAGFGGCLVVAHDPDAVVELPGCWCAPLVPGRGASVSSSR